MGERNGILNRHDGWLRHYRLSYNMDCYRVMEIGDMYDF